MNELRRSLLDIGDAPAELSPEQRFLAGRQAAMAALLVDHAELYKRLLRRAQGEGLTEEVRALALQAAGNMATVLQSLRSREDLLKTLGERSHTEPFPAVLIDQLFYSFTLLAAPSGDDIPALCLESEDIDALLATHRVHAWLRELGRA